MRHKVATAGARSIDFLSSELFEAANAIDWNAFGRASRRDDLPERGCDSSRRAGARGSRVRVGRRLGRPSARPWTAGHPDGWLRPLGKTRSCRRRRCGAGPGDIGVCRLRISAAISRIACLKRNPRKLARVDLQRSEVMASPANSPRPPIVHVIARPNGAGKTTFAREFLPAEHVVEFLNADLLAAGLCPLRPPAMTVRAGRLLLGRWRELMGLLERRRSDYNRSANL